MAEMTGAQIEFCHKVADEFRSRWEEDYDGEAYTVAEYMLTDLTPEDGGLSLAMSVDDATEAVSAFMSGPVF